MVSRGMGLWDLLAEAEARGSGMARAGSRTVLRSRLFDLVDRVFDTGVVLISEPGGFGKTVLLSS